MSRGTRWEEGGYGEGKKSIRESSESEKEIISPSSKSREIYIYRGHSRMSAQPSETVTGPQGRGTARMTDTAASENAL